jgi:hypothetical protein
MKSNFVAWMNRLANLKMVKINSDVLSLSSQTVYPQPAATSSVAAAAKSVTPGVSQQALRNVEPNAAFQVATVVVHMSTAQEDAETLIGRFQKLRIAAEERKANGQLLDHYDQADLADAQTTAIEAAEKNLLDKEYLETMAIVELELVPDDEKQAAQNRITQAHHNGVWARELLEQAKATPLGNAQYAFVSSEAELNKARVHLGDLRFNSPGEVTAIVAAKALVSQAQKIRDDAQKAYEKVSGSR